MSLVHFCLVLGQLEQPFVPVVTVESMCRPCYEWTASLALGGSTLCPWQIRPRSFWSSLRCISVLLLVCGDNPSPIVNSVYVECVIGLSMMTSMACTVRCALNGITESLLVWQSRPISIGGRLMTAVFVLSVRRLSPFMMSLPFPTHNRHQARHHLLLLLILLTTSKFSQCQESTPKTGYP